VTIRDYDDDYDAVPNESPTMRLSRVVHQGYTKDASGATVPYEYITAMTYNSKGQILSVDGPIPGTNDITSLTYDATSGDLLSVVRPIIGAASYSNYDAAGQVGRTTDVNSQSKSFSYDGRGRVVGITNEADSSTMSFVYNTAGKLDSRTDEDGVTRTYAYDTTHGRLSTETDPEGNYIAYTYDAQGNRIEMTYHKPGGERTYRKRWNYQHPNIPGKLWKEINHDDTFTEYGYDNVGNLSSVKDPKGNTTTRAYDPMNRLKTVTQPGNVVNPVCLRRSRQPFICNGC
jgi:YD repeat-containing protein